MKKLNQIKDEEYNKLKDLFDPYLKIKNQIKEAYIKYFDENRMILLIIENMIDNYNKYPNDINTESNLVLNGSISIVEFDPRDTKAEKRLQKKNPEEYSKLKIKKLLDYLKKNSVIDYSLTKIKTIDNNRIKQIAYINNNNLLLCFEETTDSLLTLNVYNPLNDFNLETSFTFKEKVEHILQYYDTNIIYIFCTEGVLSIYSIDIHSIQLIKSKTLNNFELTSITLISNNRIAGYFRDALTVEIWNFDSLTRLEKLNKENSQIIDDLNYYRYDDSVTKILEYKEELISFLALFKFS